MCHYLSALYDCYTENRKGTVMTKGRSGAAESWLCHREAWERSPREQEVSDNLSERSKFNWTSKLENQIHVPPLARCMSVEAVEKDSRYMLECCFPRCRNINEVNASRLLFLTSYVWKYCIYMRIGMGIRALQKLLFRKQQNTNPTQCWKPKISLTTHRFGRLFNGCRRLKNFSASLQYTRVCFRDGTNDTVSFPSIIINLRITKMPYLQISAPPQIYSYCHPELIVNTFRLAIRKRQNQHLFWTATATYSPIQLTQRTSLISSRPQKFTIKQLIVMFYLHTFRKCFQFYHYILRTPGIC